MSGSVDTVRPSVEHVRPSTRFLRALAVIAIVGLVCRVAYVLVSSAQVGGDGLYYHAIAGLVRDGKGFIAPGPFAKFGEAIQTAPHPPGWPVVLIGAAGLSHRPAARQVGDCPKPFSPFVSLLFISTQDRLV